MELIKEKIQATNEIAAKLLTSLIRKVSFFLAQFMTATTPSRQEEMNNGRSGLAMKPKNWQ
ncbi:MAG: hypothetical protein R3B84_13010 [Zavarzinella sp.]